MLTFEESVPGKRIDHVLSRTVYASESALFSSVFHHYAAIYLDEEKARAEGYRDLVINPYYLFNLVLGLTVVDLTETGGPFLGGEDIIFIRPVYPGETIGATSRVLRRRRSESRPSWGIVTWETEGFAGSASRDPVLRYTRSNLTPLARDAESSTGPTTGEDGAVDVH